jgi:GT2 family glycosyltransferase
MIPMLNIVSATRKSESEFWSNSALGLSLGRLAYDDRFVASISYENKQGLPQIYNAHILAEDKADIVVFMHDDVWIDDYFFVDRIIEGCTRFDVIGIAGNRRRVPNQPAWAFIDDKLTWDEKANLSGSIAHGAHPFGPVSCFGTAPAECELLDGVFLAARKSVLKDNNILFDPLFDFHFYDMDLCRSARKNGLRLSTWPICLTHQSSGSFDTPPWKEKCALYRNKWKT